ncbi:unnamed protein product [Peniophora sp. CBMAI 1063]|nr:unnamed protein product [Peniophora sp. CBMAI 1063]
MAHMPTAPPGCARSLSNASNASAARGLPTDEHPEARRGSEPTVQDIGGRPSFSQSTSAPSVATATTFKAVHRTESFRSSLAPARGRAYQACERCRKARTKCSGTHPCERCEEKRFKCEYAGQARHLQAQDRASSNAEDDIAARHAEKRHRRDTERSSSRLRHDPVPQDSAHTHPPAYAYGSSSRAHQANPISTRGLSRQRSSTLPSRRRSLPYPPPFMRHGHMDHPDAAFYSAHHTDHSSMHVHSERGHHFSFGGAHIPVLQGWREPVCDDRPYTSSSETSLSSGRIDNSPVHHIIKLPVPGSIYAPFTASRSFVAQQKTAIIDAVEDWRHAQHPSTSCRTGIHADRALTSGTHPTHGPTHDAAAAFSPPTSEDVRRILEDASIGCPRGRERAYSLPALRLETTPSNSVPSIVTLPSFSHLFARTDERRLR